MLYLVGSHIGYGIQVDTVTGANAAYGLAYEANLLGSGAALWLYLALSTAKRPFDTSRRIVVVLGFFALIASFTRAADLALVAGPYAQRRPAPSRHLPHGQRPQDLGYQPHRPSPPDR